MTPADRRRRKVVLLVFGWLTACAVTGAAVGTAVGAAIAERLSRG